MNSVLKSLVLLFRFLEKFNTFFLRIGRQLAWIAILLMVIVIMIQVFFRYVLNNALGFEDYIRGYEYYVIDGGKYIISKSSIKHELIPMTEVTLPGIPWKEFNKTHFSLYFSIFADMGFVEGDNYNNFLNNKFLFSQGISLDLVTYYDKILRLEISRNHLNEIGFFIHFSNPFGENIKAKQ